MDEQLSNSSDNGNQIAGDAGNHQNSLEEDSPENNTVSSVLLIGPARSRAELDTDGTATVNNDKPMCRICFRGASQEHLLSPCKCKGSVGFVHRNCLERWLGSRDCETCELCQFQFATVRTPKSFWEWCKHPDSSADRRNFLGDFVCFVILTPLGLASFWLCIQGAAHYQYIRNAYWETGALAALAIFLVFAYTVWIVLSVRYHCLVWRRWRQHNWNVHVIDRNHDHPINNSSSIESTDSLRTTSASTRATSGIVRTPSSSRSHSIAIPIDESAEASATGQEEEDTISRLGLLTQRGTLV